jgi:hypothetical protein
MQREAMSQMLKRRTSFHFPKEAATALQAIWARSRLGNASDVIRAALSTYNALIQIVSGGGEVIVRTKDGRQWLWSPYEPFNYPNLSSIPPVNDDKSVTRKVPRNFFFSGDAVDKLDSIKAKCFAETNADAIRIALTAYNELIGVSAVGDEIIIRDKCGNEKLYNPHAPLICDELKLVASDVTSGSSSWLPPREAVKRDRRAHATADASPSQ